jgi:hypothetical protein
LDAVEEFRPALAIGTTPVVQKAKEAMVPALYFTNLISARPLMGPAGAGSMAQVVNAAIANRARFETMRAFFAPDPSTRAKTGAAAAGGPSQTAAGPVAEAVRC